MYLNANPRRAKFLGGFCGDKTEGGKKLSKSRRAFGFGMQLRGFGIRGGLENAAGRSIQTSFRREGSPWWEGAQGITELTPGRKGESVSPSSVGTWPNRSLGGRADLLRGTTRKKTKRKFILLGEILGGDFEWPGGKKKNMVTKEGSSLWPGIVGRRGGILSRGSRGGSILERILL